MNLISPEQPHHHPLHLSGYVSLGLPCWACVHEERSARGRTETPAGCLVPLPSPQCQCCRGASPQAPPPPRSVLTLLGSQPPSRTCSLIFRWTAVLISRGLVDRGLIEIQVYRGLGSQTSRQISGWTKVQVGRGLDGQRSGWIDTRWAEV